MNPPRRPLSAYNLFFRNERKVLKRDIKAGNCQVLKDYQKCLQEALKRTAGRPRPAEFQALASTVALRWKALNEEQKETYEKMAAQDLKDYHKNKGLYREKILQECREAARQQTAYAQSSSLSVIPSCDPVATRDNEEPKKKAATAPRTSPIPPASTPMTTPTAAASETRENDHSGRQRGSTSPSSMLDGEMKLNVLSRASSTSRHGWADATTVTFANRTKQHNDNSDVLALAQEVMALAPPLPLLHHDLTRPASSRVNTTTSNRSTKEDSLVSLLLQRTLEAKKDMMALWIQQERARERRQLYAELLRQGVVDMAEQQRQQEQLHQQQRGLPFPSLINTSTTPVVEPNDVWHREISNNGVIADKVSMAPAEYHQHLSTHQTTKNFGSLSSPLPIMNVDKIVRTLTPRGAMSSNHQAHEALVAETLVHLYRNQHP